MTEILVLSTRGRLPDGAANPVDVHIGKQIYRRRQMLNLSQDKLAKLIGMTFQQVQKYERGINRVTGSRMWDLCQVLQVEPNYFFMGLNNEIADLSPRMLRYNGEGELPETVFLPEDPLLSAETMDLVTAYYRLKPRLRRLFFATIKQASRSNQPSEENKAADKGLFVMSRISWR